ncbi:MAG: choice-of-anchor B family protein [Bacteroidota bacterium]
MTKILLLLAFLCSMLASQISYNVSLFGQMDKYDGGAGDADYSEIWGWTDTVKNREYAIIGTSQGTSIVDITELPLKEVSFHFGPPSGYNYHEFRTYKNYLYVGAEGSNVSLRAGIQIIDLSTLPDSASFKKVFVWIDTLVGGGTKPYYRSHTMSIEKHFLYANGGDFGGTRIMDISDPLNPLQVGSYGKGSTPYVHDAIIRNDTLYAAAINSGRMDIVDFTAKGHYTQNTTAKIVSKTTTAPEGRTHQAWLSEDGNYMFVATEVTGGHLHIYNIANRTAPVEIATWSSDPVASIHNVFVKGDFIYIAYYGEGFRVLDIKNPSNPIEVAFYDTYPGPTQPEHNSVFHGAWGVYPYFPSGKIAVSDMNTGLYVLTVNEKHGGNVTGVVRDAGTNQIVQNVEVLVQEMGRKSLTNANGRYTYGSAAGMHTIKFSKSGYIARIESVTTIAGIIDTFDVSLTPISTGAKIVQSGVVPKGYSLTQNFPNPFNPATKIQFEIPLNPPLQRGNPPQAEGGFVTLKVYDMLGREVKTLVNEILPAGSYTVTMNASDLSSGVYYYVLTSGTFSSTKKMIVAK